MWLFSDHCRAWLAAHWSWLSPASLSQTSHSELSSTYLLMFTSVRRWLMGMTNPTGPKSVPWETPALMVVIPARCHQAWCADNARTGRKSPTSSEGQGCPCQPASREECHDQRDQMPGYSQEATHAGLFRVCLVLAARDGLAPLRRGRWSCLWLTRTVAGQCPLRRTP